MFSLVAFIWCLQLQDQIKLYQYRVDKSFGEQHNMLNNVVAMMKQPRVITYHTNYGPITKWPTGIVTTNFNHSKHTNSPINDYSIIDPNQALGR
jgi:hypothetical protein